MLTSLRLALIWLTAPVPTLIFLRLSSEVRKAAALAHNAESDAEAAAEAAGDDAVALEAVLAGLLELALDPHPAVSSARPHAMVASFHRAPRLRLRGFISRQANVHRRTRTSPSGEDF